MGTNTPSSADTPVRTAADGRSRSQKRKKRSRRGIGSKVRRIWRSQGFTPEGFERFMDRLIQAVLVAMILLAPLPLGSVAPWARAVLFVGACLLLVLWLIKSSLLGRVEIVKTPLWLFLLAYLAVLLLQLVPLPAGLLSSLSPQAAELYGRLVPGYPGETGPLPLSLNAHATVQEIYRVATFAIILFVFLNQVRHRWQIVVLLWAFVALGAFESLYGIAERFSGSPHVFWVKSYDRISVRGTYYNRNHFAGFVEMVTPLVLGFMLTMIPRRDRSFRSQTIPLYRRLLQNLSKAKGYVFLLLGLVTGTLMVSGIFSLSRGGTAGLLLGLLLLMVLAGGEKGKRRRTGLVLGSVLLLVLGLLFYRGMGQVIDRFDQLTDESSSWSGRAELRRAGLRLIGDFPLLGSGGGTFADVFIAYQPARFGDRITHYLHCDWLQVPCETGMVGALILYVGFGIFGLRLFRKVLGRSDPFPRLIAVGSLAGVGAMLWHSFFDFNLYMVTANGLIFTVLLGICHTAVHMKGKARGSRETFALWSFPVREGARRLLIPAVVLVLCVLAAIRPVKSGLADLAFSRYLTWAEGAPDNYFFWKTPSLRVEEAGADLERAARLDGGSPDLLFHQGLFQVKTQEERIGAEARELALRVYSPDLAGQGLGDLTESVQALAQDMTLKITGGGQAPDEDSAEFRALVSAFADTARSRLAGESKAVLEQAEPSFRQAARRCPTVPWYHLDLAMAYETLLPPGSAVLPERHELDRLVQNALTLAPNRSSTVYLADWYSLQQALFAGGERRQVPPEVLDRVLSGFREVLRWTPRAYASQIYPLLLDQARLDPKVLFDVTPDVYISLRMLSRFCLSRRMWPQALEAIDALLAFFPEGAETRATAELPPDADPFDLFIMLSSERMRILRLLGDAEGWNQEARKIAALFAPRCWALHQEAQRFISLGRFLEAVKSSEDCLKADRGNKDAMLSLMQAETRPERFKGPGYSGEVLSRLYRFFRLVAVLSPEDCEQVGAVLAQLAPATPSEHVFAQIAEAAQAIRCGRPEEAANRLKALMVVEESLFRHWNQRHLLNHYLGAALEAAGSREAAVGQYRQALALAPSHVPSLTRLEALGEGDALLPPPQVGTLPAAFPPVGDSASEAQGLTSQAVPSVPSAPPGSVAAPPAGGDAALQGTQSEHWSRVGELAISEEGARELRTLVDQVMKDMQAMEATPGAAVAGAAAAAAAERTVRQRLAELSPGSSWGIDFSGKVTLVGTDFEWEKPAGDPASPAGPGKPEPTAAALPATAASPVGFTARYFWQVQEDLDPRNYWVRYLYFDSKQNLGYLETQPLLVGPEWVPGSQPGAARSPGPQPPLEGTGFLPSNLDGGIGTVLVQWHYVPLPLEAAREVRILVKKRREGKPGFAPALVPETGERWLALGTPFQALPQRVGSGVAARQAPGTAAALP